MKKGDLLFVYGTLMKRERADLSNNSNAFGFTYVGEDEINGELFNLGPYPGAKAVPGCFDPGAHHIKGEVYKIRDGSVVAMIDAYEGYPHLYNRIETETARGLHVWVYVYVANLTEDRMIASGSWRERMIQQIAA